MEEFEVAIGVINEFAPHMLNKLKFLIAAREKTLIDKLHPIK